MAQPNAGASNAIYVQPTEGESFWLHGDVYTTKLKAADTGGVLSLIEASVPPGGGPRLHVHKNEDELFYIIHGELDVIVGEASFHAQAGAVVYAPKNTPHCFKNNGFHFTKLLLIFTPGGFDGFFADAGLPAQAGVAAPVFDPDRHEYVAKVSNQYNAYQLK